MLVARWCHQHMVCLLPQGYVTTLKRNGSDYTATILGALFGACHITIWTDVDGVYSADPRKVGCGILIPIRIKYGLLTFDVRLEV